MCERIEASSTSAEARRSLGQLLLKVHDATDLLTESVVVGGASRPTIDGLIALNERRAQWIRPLEAWAPRSHNGRRQFSSLVRHLLARYPVPLFMDEAWFRRDEVASNLQDWFLLVGSGWNIRIANTPIPLTKKMAHCFLEAPDDYTIEQALRWGQVRALGGDRRLMEVLRGTRLVTSFEHEDFWITVIRFFVANPLLDRAQIGPIVDYLHHQRFEPQNVFVARGVRERRPPPQPQLCMKGRTAATLLRQVEGWHRGLGRMVRASSLEWAASGIRELELEVGIPGRNLRIWRIRELLSSAELVAEGRTMRHCIATYAGSCAAGAWSIWAMELHGFDGVEKRQTIAVNRQKIIVESRGKYNRYPDQQELEILQRWAAREGLHVGRSVQRV